jgi:hypothetical protein
MAVYRLEAKVISRTAGRSATAAAAYRAGARIDDERTGQSFDYTDKPGVLHTEILAPAGTPDWMLDRSQLWNAVERAEKRRDSQLARDFTLSLPHELTHDQRVELLRDFLGADFVARGMIADFAVHAPDREGDQRNHHAHVMLTMRSLTGSGFGLKVREWNATEQLEAWRESWANTVNRHLERHGHEARVDHRSLADQGIDREPEPKQGPVATDMERDGRASNAGDDRRAVQERNRARDELAHELGEIKAEIIYLDPEMLRRRDATPVFDGDDNSKRGRPRGSVALATTDGGMVAQQAEAMRRFRRNSERLQGRGASVEDPPPPLGETSNSHTLGSSQAASDDMAAKYDALRAEHSKAPIPEPPEPKIETEAVEQSPPEPEVKAQQATRPPPWSFDQSMPSQGASATAWAKAGAARRQEQFEEKSRGTSEEAPEVESPDIVDSAEHSSPTEPNCAQGIEQEAQSAPEPAAPTPEIEQAERKLRFYADRDPGRPDRASLKREHSEAEPSKTDDGSRKLNFARDRDSGPDLDR